jgi:ectoine hydroxylase-related dioxygenase (phytanoyl-CoA dioxygenase family)
MSSLNERIQTAIQDLETRGYCVIRNVLPHSEVVYSRLEFFNWYNDLIDSHDFDNIENASIHGIFKGHEVGHQRFAWRIRTNPNVRSVFENLYNTTELVTSFDGSCYMPHELNKVDRNEWMHTDQTSSSEKDCIQSWVSLTNNSKRVLTVIEGSHLEHGDYFQDNNIEYTSRNWLKISPEWLKRVENSSRIKKVEVSRGDMVLWDSRTFHRNTYGPYGNGEERIVQFVCMKPKNDPRNTTAVRSKRRDYFNNRRTTSHWPYPIRVNAKQPRTYGNDSLSIDYSKLIPPNLDDMREQIEKLL